MAIQDLTPQLRTRLRRVEKIVGFFVAFAALVLVVAWRSHWIRFSRPGSPRRKPARDVSDTSP